MDNSYKEIISLYKQKIDPNTKNIEWVVKSCLSGINRPYPLDSKLLLAFLQRCTDKHSLQSMILSYYRYNLINPTFRYYHSMLNIIPSVKKYEDEDGNLISIESNEAIRTKNLCRYKDLLSYFKLKVSYLYIDEKRDLNALHHLLTKVIPQKLKTLTNHLEEKYFDVYDDTSKTYTKIPYQSLDILIFAIDATITYCSLNDVKVTGIFDIEKFIEQGFAMYCDKKNNMVEDRKWMVQTKLDQIDI